MPSSASSAGTLSARRVQSRSRPPPHPVVADSRSGSGSDNEGSPAPRMSISLFLDGATTPSSSASRLPPSVSQPLSSPSSSSSDFPIADNASSASPAHTLTAAAAAPTERYFQRGDVIFVVPPSHNDSTAGPSSPLSISSFPFSSAPLASPSSSPSDQLSPSASSACCVSSAVFYPSVHVVDVYLLPSLSCVSTLRGHDSCVEQVYRDEWCEASDTAITQTALGSVYVWALSTGELIQRMEAKSEWLSAFLMTRRLFPLPAITHVSALVLDDSQLPAAAGGAATADDEDDAMLSGVSGSVCVYENQRFYPLLGWSTKLLPTDRPPFSNAKGTRELSKRTFKLLPRWRWTTGWEVLRDDTTDVDGWSYAIDFSGTSRKGEYRGFHRKAFLHNVRRRKWIRHRQTTHEPTAEALASATLDDYIEHKQTTPLLLPAPDSPRSVNQSLAAASTQVSDKKSRSTPLLSPTPISTRRRKAKVDRQAEHLTADESRVLTRPTSRSTASDHEPPIVSQSASYSPSPRSAHVLPLSSLSSAATSASTSPSLPSPNARRRHVSATSRDNSITSSSPPVSPSTLSSVLNRVRVELQPSNETKQTIKRMLLSHQSQQPPGKPNPPSSDKSTTASITAAPVTRPKSVRRSAKAAVRSAGADHSSDEQKERPSPAASKASDYYSSVVMESKEWEGGSAAAAGVQQRARDNQTKGKKDQSEVNEEPPRRKKPISYNTLPSPPRSNTEHSLALPASSTASSSTISSSSASSSSPDPSAPIRVEVWENQRNYPVLGWSARLLPTDPYPPFSDSAGHVLTFEMQELLLPLNMDWLGDWQVRRSSETDGEGWQYAVDWSWDWSSKQRVLTTVRRRCWMREKAVRGDGHVMEKAGSKGRAGRRKQRMTAFSPSSVQVSGKRSAVQAANGNFAHSRSQSLYGATPIPLSSSMHSLSSLVSSSAPSSSPLTSSSSSTVSSQSRRPSQCDVVDSQPALAPVYYDPSAGEPEEL